MLEGQSFDKESLHKRRAEVKGVVNEMTPSQLNKSLVEMMLTEQRIDDGESRSFFNTFGKRANAILELPESLDELTQKGIGKPIIVKTAGEEQLIGAAFSVSESDKFSHILIFKNRKVALTEPQDEASKLKYLQAFGQQTNRIIFPSMQSAFDEEGNLYDACPLYLLGGMYQNFGVSIVNETHVLEEADQSDNDGLVEKMEGALEKINRELDGKKKAA